MINRDEFQAMLDKQQQDLEQDARYMFKQTLRGQKALNDHAEKRAEDSEKANNARFKAGVNATVRVGDGVKKHSTQEHEQTRKHISQEHDSTRAHVTKEADRVITAAQTEHNSTRAHVTTVGDSIRTDVRRFCGIDVRIWAFIIPIAVIAFMVGFFKIGPVVAVSGLFIQRDANGTQMIDPDRDAAILSTMKWLFGLLSMVIGCLIADAIGSIVLYFVGGRNNNRS